MAKKPSARGSEADPVMRPANPDYRRTPPIELTVNGLRCVNVDAESILALRDYYAIAGVK